MHLTRHSSPGYTKKSDPRSDGRTADTERAHKHVGRALTFIKQQGTQSGDSNWGELEINY